MAGARVAPSEGAFKHINLPLVIGGGIIAVLLIAYLGLCTWVMGLETILPGTSISGVDVSGMTATQVEEVMNDQLQVALAEYPVTVSYGGEVKELDPTMLQWDNSFMDTYFEHGRENLFASGANYLGRLMGQTAQNDSVVYIADGSLSQLEGFLSTDNWNVAGAPVDASYQVDGEELILTKAVTGLAFDLEVAKDDIQTATTIVMNYVGGVANATLDGSQVNLVVAETPGTEVDLATIRLQLSGDTADAYMNENYEIVPHVLGADFDLETAQSTYDSLGEGESISVDLSETGDVLTTEEFEALLFADELTTSSSYVSGTTDRRTNVKVAAGLTDGTILLPGETFSYAAILQGCPPSLGFQTGTGYVNGESVDVTGGGVCQVSSTLYYGLLSTSLEIAERRAHSYVPGYVPNGMDATYYGGSIDFKFTNNTGFPLKILTSYSSGNYLTTTVVGTKTDTNVYVPRSSSSDYKSLAPTYVADESVTPGSTVTMQTAYTGCITSVYWDVYDQDMNFLYSEYLYTDYYSARSAVYHYNPADAASLGLAPTETTTTPTEPEVTAPEVEEPVETETPDVTETPEEPEISVEEVVTETQQPAEEETVVQEEIVQNETESTVLEETVGETENDDGAG